MSGAPSRGGCRDNGAMRRLERRRWLGCAAALALASLRRPVAGALPMPVHRRLGALLFDAPESWRFLEVDLAKALAGHGWIEGRNLDTQWLYAGGDLARLQAHAQALARAGVDAIVTRGTPATRALHQASRTVPIVTGVGDPIGAGFAATLARPGGNVTGVSYALPEASQKRLELLRELRPRLARLTAVLDGDRAAFAHEITAPLERVAHELGCTQRVLLASSLDEVRAALRSVPSAETEAALVYSFGTRIAPQAIADAAVAARVPAMFEQAEYVEAGGLMSFGFRWDDQTGRTADQLDQVLRGASPAEIPFELPTHAEFAVNIRTAQALGIALPPALLARADRVVS
jgi:putative ABC transport system substrate-binding protein